MRKLVSILICIFALYSCTERKNHDYTVKVFTTTNDTLTMNINDVTEISLQNGNLVVYDGIEGETVCSFVIRYEILKDETHD